MKDQTDMQLIDSETRQPLRVGQKVKTSRGEECTLTGWRKPHKPNSEGFVHVRAADSNYDSEYYAGVIGAEFYPRPDRGAENEGVE